MMDFFKTLGCYPPSYNPKVHGPYIAFRNYGPPDKHLGDVKLSELKDWLMRRNLSVRTIPDVYSRSRHLWYYKWLKPKNANGAFVVQFTVLTSLAFYVCSFEYQRSLMHRRYH